MNDTEMLNWMIFNSAEVCHSRDGDDCWVSWYDDEGGHNQTKLHHNSREAIQAAMNGF